MELNFASELGQNEGALSQNQLSQFHNKMRESTVSIISAHNNSTLNCGGGVIINGKGDMLTTSSVLDGKATEIYVCVHGRGKFLANVFFQDREMDLAIIKIKDQKAAQMDKNPLNYAGLELEPSSIKNGSEVFMISTNRSDSIFHVGQVAYPLRILKDIMKDEYEHEHASQLDPELKVIQLNNIHGHWNFSRGSPLFNQKGKIIGIESFMETGFDFAIHVSVVRAFVEKVDAFVEKMTVSRVKGAKRLMYHNCEKTTPSCLF